MRGKLFIYAIIAFFALPSFSYAQVKNPAMASDFKLADLNNKFHELREYKNKENVLLFFWTTWCPFCRKEVKKLSLLYKGLKSDGVELLAIDAGEPYDRIKRFVKANDIKFEVLLDQDSSVSDSYGIMGVPTFFLIDKQGSIVFEDNDFPEKYKAILPKD